MVISSRKIRIPLHAEVYVNNKDEDFEMGQPVNTLQILKSLPTFSSEFNSLLYCTFFTTGIDSIKAHGFCVTVCDVEGGEGPRFFHSDKKHAEWYMVNYWEEFARKTKWRYITIRVFQSYSPCGDCSELITQFVKKMAAEGITLTIKLSFAGQYKLCRKPWTPDGYKNHFTVDDHLKNSRGLQQLAQYVELDSFHIWTWTELKCMLNLEDCILPTEQKLGCKRSKADVSIRHNFLTILLVECLREYKR